MANLARKAGRSFRRIRLVPCAFLLALAPLFASAGESPANARLHAAMNDALSSQGLQGAVWTTVDDDGTIEVDAAGIRDARTGIALRAQDRVHVGSVAKTVLATGVLQLVSEGRLALDTPVPELLPAIAFDNPWAADGPVRIRHLLDHTAGLDDARLADMFSLRANADAPLAVAFAGRTLQVRSRPGSRHSYSNTGYTLLGMVIEAVTGARYETHLREHLLAPLGMHDSTFAFTTQAAPHADPRVAMGHFEDGIAQAAVPMAMRPAGQFTTTATDMGRFARFLMGDGTVDGKRIVDAALLRAMGRPQGTEAARAGLRVGYALGMATRDRHGAVGTCHGGSTVGYRAMLCLFPGHGRAFFVAINADHESADYGRFDRLLVESLDVGQPSAPPDTTRRVDPSAWEGYYVPAPNRFARLEWIDTTLNFVRVRREGESLRFQPLQSKTLVLAPMGDALFRMDDRTGASHAVFVADNGHRAISTGLQTYERVAPVKLAALWASLGAGVLGIAWLLFSGLARILTGARTFLARPALVPFLGIVALLLPLPLFLRQPFLAMGDLTIASGSLACVTALLPLAMTAGLALSLRRRQWSAIAVVDAVAMAAVLQWTLVLAWWGLWPARLWI